MKIYTIILAKGNSERIKNKNLYKIKGITLLEHSINHSIKSKSVSETFVSSESEDIKNVVDKCKVNFIKRPKYLCKKKSTREDALIHALKYIEKYYGLPDYIVFLQATSPYRKNDDIDNCIKKLINEKADSIFSSSLYKNHIWNINKKNKLKAINHDMSYHLMHQYKYNQIIENGSMWVFNSIKFLKYKNRLFGKITHYLMDEQFSYQIDEKHDIKIIEALMNKN